MHSLLAIAKNALGFIQKSNFNNKLFKIYSAKEPAVIPLALLILGRLLAPWR